MGSISNINFPTMSETVLNNEVSSGETIIEWSYSGKAMRGQALLFLLISLAAVTGGGSAMVTKWCSTAYPLMWICIIGGLLLLWGYHYAVYFYRVWTIHYRLTDRHFYSYNGLLTRVCDSMELIHIDDMQLIQTLVDRIFNGGVGHLVIFCAADKVNQVLHMKGIDNPKEIFEKINSLRTALRAKRSILSTGG